jgi:hypothetical protein
MCLLAETKGFGSSNFSIRVVKATKGSVGAGGGVCALAERTPPNSTPKQSSSHKYRRNTKMSAIKLIVVTSWYLAMLFSKLSSFR